MSNNNYQGASTNGVRKSGIRLPNDNHVINRNSGNDSVSNKRNERTAPASRPYA